MMFSKRIDRLIEQAQCFNDSDEVFHELMKCVRVIYERGENNLRARESLTYWMTEAATHIYGQDLWMQTAKALLETIKKEKENGNV